MRINKTPLFLLLNGPPGSGKDTAVEAVPGVYNISFAKIVKERTHASFGIHNVPYDCFENSKDIPNPLFHGKTPRQAYIAFSETYYKPMLGEDIFGKVLAESHEVSEHNEEELIFITDSGFEPESLRFMKGMRDVYDDPKFVLVRLHRKGCNFNDDSRSYLYIDSIPSYDICNAHLEDYLNDIRKIVKLEDYLV